MAAALQLQLPPGGVPVRGLAELPPDGDPRGEDALGGQARRLELRRQGRMRDADAVQLQLAHPGGAGEIRGHEPGGHPQTVAAAQLRHHHGREHVHADGRVGSQVHQRLIQGADAPDAVFIQQGRGALLLHAIARAVQLGGIAIGKVVAPADQVRRPLGQKVQGVIGPALVSPGGQLLRQGGGCGVVPAAGVAGENGNFHRFFLFSFSARRSRRGLL